LLLLAIFWCATPAYSDPVLNTHSELGSRLGLPVLEWRDNSVPHKGIILAIHALLLSGASYDNFAQHLASMGYTVYAPDVRGFGRWRTELSKVDSGSHADFIAAKRDLVRTVTQLRKENPHEPIILLGESMGADYSLWLLSEGPAQLVDAAIVCAPGFKFQFHWSRQVPIDCLFVPFHPRKQVKFEHYLGRYLANNGEVTRTWQSNPSIARTFSACELIHARAMSRSAFRHVKRIPEGFPMLILAGANDQVFQSAAIPKRAKHFGSQNLSIQILPNKGHILLEAQHVDDETTTLVDDWLATHATHRDYVRAAIPSMQMKQ
jgi:alpha-beta hydrolase superfamily lysophospholipase